MRVCLTGRFPPEFEFSASVAWFVDTLLFTFAVEAGSDDNCGGVDMDGLVEGRPLLGLDASWASGPKWAIFKSRQLLISYFASPLLKNPTLILAVDLVGLEMMGKGPI